MRGMISVSVMMKTGCAIPCTSQRKRIGKRDVNFTPRTVDTFQPKVEPINQLLHVVNKRLCDLEESY